MVLGDNPIMLMGAVGALGKIVGLAAEPPLEIYDEATRAAVRTIPPIGAGETSGGSVEISIEEIIAARPDLVVGNASDESGITPDSLARAGVPVITLPSFCTDAAQSLRNPGFADVYSQIGRGRDRQIELYGRLFGNEDAAAAADLKQRVTSVERSVQSSSRRRSAATLFVYLGTDPPGAYGADSMSNATGNDRRDQRVRWRRQAILRAEHRSYHRTGSRRAHPAPRRRRTRCGQEQLPRQTRD